MENKEQPTYAERLKWWIEIGKPLLVDHGIYVEFENRTEIQPTTDDPEYY